MLKQLFSLDHGRESIPDGIRASSAILALYVAFLPIATGLTGLIGSISPLNYIAALYFVVSFAELLRHPHPLFKKEFFLIYLYFAYTAASFLWNGDKQIEWQLTTFLTTALLFAFAAGHGYNEKELKLFVIASLVSIAIVFAVVAANFPTHSIRMVVRIVETMDPNDFGCGLCVVIAMVMTMSLEKKNRWMVLILVLLFMTIILSSSRGAMLMASVMMIWWIGAAAAKKKILIPLIPILLVGLLALAVLVFFPQKFNLSEKTIQFIIKRMNLLALLKDGGAGRSTIWRAAVNSFLQFRPIRMIFGYGHGAFAQTVQFQFESKTYLSEAHNMYLKALIEGGIVGLLLLLSAFLQIFIYSIKRHNLWGTLAVIGFAVEGISLHAQVFRVFAWVFIVAAIYKGGDSFELQLSSSGDGDRPGLQS